MRVALYARVSTTEQTVAPQLDSLRAALAGSKQRGQGDLIRADKRDHCRLRDGAQALQQGVPGVLVPGRMAQLWGLPTAIDVALIFG